ncbi:hypothetical protein [Halobellus ordinarius]|uniref:hypothetical protein n=1 Tax=Halobellus ordinarius TaxID=3075120 RepID=UPI00288093D8|nr:hypothetical protein [Halobellus sp. ZY16]
MTPLDFAAKRDGDSASWERADPTGALIERIAWNTWLVTLPDSETTYEVELATEHGAYVGDCTVRDSGEQCPARKFNDRDEPCAHLCTLRKAAFLGIDDDRGESIDVFERDDAAIAAADAHIETAMADGGVRR